MGKHPVFKHRWNIPNRHDALEFLYSHSCFQLLATDSLRPQGFRTALPSLPNAILLLAKVLPRFADLVAGEMDWSLELTKTQSARIETHIWIVYLLRYLKNHYLPDLQVTDEGAYWDRNDPELLAEKRRFLQGKIDRFAAGLTSRDAPPPPADLVSLIAEIERIFEREA